jgi:hypothetical protein
MEIPCIKIKYYKQHLYEYIIGGTKIVPYHGRRYK